MGVYDRILRLFLNRLTPYLDFIVFYLLFPGGLIYGIVQFVYVRLFDRFVRQKKSRESTPRRTTLGNPQARLHASDCESSTVIGRNRRITRSSLKSYLKRSDILNKTHHKTSVLTESPTTTFLLTGEAGEPSGTHEWLFCLVGSPEECPDNWMGVNVDTNMLSKNWSRVTLPNHWQLQGFDVPLYTNTTYPFEFDPPRARRTGIWTDTACDLGLGSEPCSAAQPLRQGIRSNQSTRGIHPNEPGENATGLFRCSFSLAALLNKSSPRRTSAEKSKRVKRAQWADRESQERSDAQPHRLFLVFGGVDSCMSVWLNGQYIGYSQDSCLPAEFDITEACKKVEDGAQHTLAVQVSRFCDGSYLEDQDKWWLSGIYREVHIERRPMAFISDFEVSSTVHTRTTITRLKDDKNVLTFSGPAGTGEVTGPEVTVDLLISVLAEGVHTTSNSPNARPHGVRIEVWQNISDDQPVATFTKELANAVALPNRSVADAVFKDRRKRQVEEAVSLPISPGLLTVKGTLHEPFLWTAETPFLYTIVISLYPSIEDANSDVNDFHSVTHKIGFRKVSIGGPDHVLRVNDSPITVAGINRHEFNARTGRAVSKQSMREDAISLKKLNFNAVRSAHYPQHPYWLEVCDEIGLYVIDEANIESHGFQVLGQPVGYLSGRPEWETAIASRVTRMFERDKNHACVIGWSLGNESGHGATHDLMARWLRLRDPSRFVQYESGGARTAATDIICPMYMRSHWCEEQSLRDSQRRPVILCEYAHAMGNSGGALSTYWQLFRDSRFPRLQGGFIWDFVDQGLTLPSGVGYGYGGDFGDSPNTKQFCCNGIAGPDRDLFPTALEAAHLQAPVEVTMLFDHMRNPVLIVSNRRSFATLSDLKVVVRPCYHSNTLNSYVKGAAFDILCGAIPAGSFLKFDIADLIRDSLEQSGMSLDVFDSADLDAPEHQICPAEAWLDISVLTLPGSYAWHPDPFEVMHTALVSEALKVALKRLSSHISASPFPMIQQPAAAHQSDSRNNSGASSPFNSTPASSPLPFTRKYPAASISYGVRSESLHVQVIEHMGGKPGLFVRWSDGAVATIGKDCGRLVSWQDRQGHELLSAPVDGCLYRAATDNDRGGMILSYYARWKEVGLDRMVRRNQKNSITSQRRLTDGSIEVVTNWVWDSPKDAKIRIRISARGCYTFNTTGSIDVDFSAEASSNTPLLARCGLRWAMPAEYGEVKYFGLGPHEAYDDRKACAFLGVFEKKIRDLHTHYTVPQECGRRADPRWIIFKRNDSSSGLAVVPLAEQHPQLQSAIAHSSKQLERNPLLVDAVSCDNASAHASSTHSASPVQGWGFSASRFSLETLDSTTHDHELLPDPDGKVHVHLDSRTMGLGGYDSWSPNVDEGFLVQPQLVPTTMRQATMPAFILPKASKSKPRALHTAVRLIPLSHV